MLFNTYEKISDFISKEEIIFCNFRFTDQKGKTQQITYNSSSISQSTFEKGVTFDGSSIPGWKEINNSDMIILPDISSGFVDPFTIHPTLVFFCDVIDPDNNNLYERDPRSTAKKAEKYLLESGIADHAFFGPELEFFVFDAVNYKTSTNKCFYAIDSHETEHNSNDKFLEPNLAHRPGVKGGYMAIPPTDSLYDLRTEISLTLEQVGLTSILHHHEVASGQCELAFKYSTLLETADNVLKYKYVVHNVTNNFNKTATFMPKPIYGDNGSGMHIHQSLWKDKVPLFSGDEYANLSETCLYYIGGIIKHAKALNAFTNPTTNSYKRLVPGFEAPVLLAYSSHNRSASIRIPYVHSPQEKRIETRFPDPTANPYYAFSAMLMAGLDGIKNKIHPGKASEKNLYDLSQDELDKVDTVSGSLREALENLNSDREFLKEGGVFTDDQIDSYISLKLKEVQEFEQTPHPIEYKLYYSS